MASDEEKEYEQGFGSGPYGMREVKLPFFRNFYFNPVVTFGGAIALWLFVALCLLEPEDSKQSFSDGKAWVAKWFTWLYIASQDYWLLFMVPLGYYYGHVKLGKDDEEPQYGDASYFTMVFSAGVAIGLIFYGASEPLYHMKDGDANRYSYTGYGTYTGYLNDNEVAQNGINITLFHWGLQAWVVYALTAVAMGFLSHRHGLPLCFRTTLAPLFGKATWGWMGDVLDVVTIVTIVAGLCTSLGMGAKQIVGGMQRLEILDGDLSEDEVTNASCITVAVITVFATFSVVSGLDIGIKTLSQAAFLMGNFLLLVVLFLDKTWFILNVMVQSLGYHVQNFIALSFDCDAFALPKGEGHPIDGKGADPRWMNWWTIFYWGWWIAWAPFVGTFLARISRGRTIRNVLAFTLTVPSFYALVWFCTFGSAAIRMDRRADYLAEMGTTLHSDALYFAVPDDMFRPVGAGMCYRVPAADELGLDPETYDANLDLSPVCSFTYTDAEGYWFDLMGQYHSFGTFLVGTSVVTTVLYFITSSDSGSLVVDLIAANGREAHVIQRVIWAFTEGAVAIALIQAGGEDSLKALQAMSIMAGLPFTIILMFMVTALWRALKVECGDMGPRWERTDWKLPLYGGIFDYGECVLSLGRSPMPDVESVKLFFMGIFAAPLIFWTAMDTLHRKQKPTYVVYNFLTVICALSYVAFWVFAILGWAGVTSGLYGFAFVSLTVFATVVTIGRMAIRETYGIQGSALEDLLAAFFFLWPLVLAQMAYQTKCVDVSEIEAKKAKKNAGQKVEKVMAAGIREL